MSATPAPDQATADAFSTSWLKLPPGSIYTYAQFQDWMEPLTREDFTGRSVLEMGCGNGSLLLHAASWQPRILHGVDLGDSVRAARANLEGSDFDNWMVEQADLTTFRSGEAFDLVYCIGVLHHLKTPLDGLRAVIENVKPGGKFHCWVYAREGNLVVRLFVEPLRWVFSKAPWWLTKHVVANFLAYPVFAYAKLIAASQRVFPWTSKLPLSMYLIWISKREVGFMRHVIFDQLVTPTTRYISRREIEDWLRSRADVQSTYITLRNGNSWRFGGTKLA
jgi:SAM-dependent methyltransferase